MDSKGSPTTPIQASSYFPSDPTNPIPANHSSLAKVEGLKTLVHKRVATFSHLHRVLEGKSHYFNTVLITKEDLSSIYDNNKMKKRSLQYFTLGTSLGPIIDIQNPIDFIKSLVSLLQEYEGFSNNDGMKQKRRPFFRKSRTLEDSINTSNNSTDSNDFTNLDIRNIPFELDYLQVFYALCNIICIIYDKIQLHLLNNNCPQVYLDCVFKIDGKFKKIINLVTKELDLIVHQSIKEELGVIDPLMSQKSGGQFDDWETSSVVSP